MRGSCTIGRSKAIPSSCRAGMSRQIRSRGIPSIRKDRISERELSKIVSGVMTAKRNTGARCWTANARPAISRKKSKSSSHFDDATDMNTPVLQVSHLRKQFGDFTAVDDVSFSIRPGEILGLLGPNGAGKTTTIHML